MSFSSRYKSLSDKKEVRFYLRSGFLNTILDFTGISEIKRENKDQTKYRI